jgi:TonB family protein
MFEVLLASGSHVDFKGRWLTTSVLTHALIIALALLATQSALEAPRLIPPNEMSLLFVPKPAAPEAKAEPRAPRVVVAEPPAQGFQTVVAPNDIPNVIPPIDLTQRPLDPRDFTGRGVEGGVAEGVIGGTGPVGDLDAIYEATTSVEGFEPAVVLSQPVPQYPASLAAVGIEGQVMMEFVIDTTGRVQPASIKVIQSTHQAFEMAARSAMTAAIFRPAHLGRHPVRQLTRQSVRFVAAN